MLKQLKGLVDTERSKLGKKRKCASVRRCCNTTCVRVGLIDNKELEYTLSLEFAQHRKAMGSRDKTAAVAKFGWQVVTDSATSVCLCCCTRKMTPEADSLATVAEENLMAGRSESAKLLRVLTQTPNLIEINIATCDCALECFVKDIIDSYLRKTVRNKQMLRSSLHKLTAKFGLDDTKLADIQIEVPTDWRKWGHTEVKLRSQQQQ